MKHHGCMCTYMYMYTSIKILHKFTCMYMYLYVVKVTVQFERCFRLMEHISVISCRNPRNLYITEKLIKFSKSLFYFLFGNLKYKIKRMNALFSDLCFPFPEFQVRRVAFDGTNYYIFIFDTVYSPKPCQRFLKGHFVCILQQKPRNSTFVIETVGVLSC